MSAEKKLIKQIRSIVYEKQADPDQITKLVIKYRLTSETVTLTNDDRIIYNACLATNADPMTVLSKSRKGSAPSARYFIWSQLRKQDPNRSFEKIGMVTGGHDHATVMHGIRTLKEWLDVDRVTIRNHSKFLNLVEPC